jgi:hypothetical protein
MSGANVPYHLRTNKAIDRHLFIDVLEFVRRWNYPSKYVYASMGGRFLEDFRAVNDRMHVEKMISIEMDKLTHARQEFNLPFGFLECRNVASGAFIEKIGDDLTSFSDHRFVVWLDFAAANERGSQLNEYGDLIRKLCAGDVIRLTLNANPNSIEDPANHRNTKSWRLCTIDGLKAQMGDYLPTEVKQEDLTLSGFAVLLATAAKTAATHSLNNISGRYIRPLGVYRYQDQQQMLTITAMICDDGLMAKINADPVFEGWDMASHSWEKVHHIRVPDLSLKERELINSLMSKQKK